MATHPRLDGYTFRSIDVDRDLARLAEIINEASRADGVEGRTTGEQMAAQYRNAENCDMATDSLIAERDGIPVGYTRTTWWQVLDGPRLAAVFAPTMPDARADGLPEALVDWSERRGREVAEADGATDAQFESWAEERRMTYMCDIYTSRGYTVDTHGASMVRPHLDDIGEVVLPDGVEIRPVEESQLRVVWDADIEAFRDHYGAVGHSDGRYQEFLDDPRRDVSLWQVAWAGDTVVGQVRSYVDHEENAELGIERGYTEYISTRRDWRKRGIATALINASLRELADRGYQEAALGVHTENPNGAFSLYESLGYEVTEMWATYRKPIGG